MMIIKKTILIIEDSKDILEIIIEILEFSNYKVLSANNGKTGVELAQAYLPDLILCDIMMSDLDGYGVLYLIRKNDKTAAIPFVFLSAKTERSDLRKGMDLGADDYLSKPFDDIELLRAIESRLKKHDRQQMDHIKALSLDNLMNVASSERLLEELSGNSRIRTYKKKQNVYMEGDVALSVFLVKKGSVRTYMVYQDGREITLGLYGMGEFFGYESVLLNTPCTDNAETLQPSELCMVSREDFNTLVFRDHGISKKFIELLSGSVKEKQDLLLKLAYDSVRKRVADALLDLAGKFGLSMSDSISIQTSREDMASMAGTSNETISRTLTDFKDELLIEKNGSTINILSLDRLRSIKQ